MKTAVVPPGYADAGALNVPYQVEPAVPVVPGLMFGIGTLVEGKLKVNC